MPKGLNSFRQQTMREMMLLMNDMNRLTSSQGFKDSLNLGLTDQIMSANKAALTLGQTLQKSVNPLTGNLNLTAFNNELKRSSMTLTDYSKQLSQLGSVGQESFKSLTKAIISAETPLTASSKLAQEMGVVIGNTMRWQAASSAIHGVLNTASQAVNYVRNLDSSLNDIRIVTGQSEEQMERFARQANQAAKELNTTTNQYAKASLIYYQQGLSDKQVAERTETTIKLANVTGQAAKSVSNEMTAIWNNFYNGSKSLEYYADVITALGATTASSSEEIAKGLSKFSSIAQTTGLSYEYATSALSTVVAATRQSADTVGTSFKTLFSRLQGLNLGQTLDDGTTLNKYSKALLTAGVNIKQANGQLKDMDTILSELSTKWEALGNAQKVALAQTVGGARNYSTFMSLMENWDDFTTNLQTAYNAQGTLQRQADIYADSWQAASAHVRASAESIYSNLIDDKAFKGMINGFGDVLDVVGRATDTMGGFKGVLMQTAAIATRAYGPQLAEGLSNLGYSAMNLLPGGKARVENLRQQALENLMANTSMTQLEKDYATSFSNRNRSYLEGVKNGTISPTNQALLQTFMGHVDTLENNALNLTNAAESQRTATFSDIRTTAAQMFYDIQTNATREDDGSITGGRYGREIMELQDRQGKLAESNDILRDQLDNPIARRQYNQNIKEMGENARRIDDLTTYRTNFNAQYGNDGRKNFADTYYKNLTDYGKTYASNKYLQDLAYAFQPNDKGTFKLDGGAWDTGKVNRAISNIEKIVAAGKEGNGTLSNLLGLNGKQADDIEAMVKSFEKLGPNATMEQKGQFLTDNYGIFTEDLLLDSNAKVTNAEGKLKAFGQRFGQEEAVASSIQEIKDEQDALREAVYARSDAKLANTGLMGMMQNIKNDKTGFTTALVNSASNIAGLSSMIMAGSNALKIFNSETATAMDKMGAFTSLAMTAPMGLRGAANVIKDFGALFPGEVGKAAKAAGGSAKTFGVGLGAAAVTAAIVGVMAAVNQSEKESYDNQIKSLTQAGIASKQNATIAKESSESFGAISQAYQKSIGDLSQYQEGTTEYYNSLLSANEQALELINTYGLTGESYSVDSKGLVQINAGELLKQQEVLNEQAKQASINAIVSSGIARVADISNTLYTQTDRPLIEISNRAAQRYGGKRYFTGQDIVDLFNAAQQENPNLKYGDWWNQAGFTHSYGVRDAREVGQKTIGGYIGDFFRDRISILNGLGSTAVQKAFGTFNDKQTQAVLEKMANGQAITDQGVALQKELASVLNTIGAVSEDQTGRTQLAALQLAANADNIDIQKLFGAALNIFKDGTERDILEAAYKTHVDENVSAATLSALDDEQIKAAVQSSIEYRELKTLIDEEANQLHLTDEQIREYKNFNTATQSELKNLISRSISEGNDFWQYFTDKNSQAGASLLESIFENINLEDFDLTNDNSFKTILSTIAKDISMSDRGILEGYITEFGTRFGPELAGVIAKNLVNVEGTGINKNYENLLSRLDSSNVISTLYSAEQGMKLYERDSVRSEQLKEIVKKGMDSIGGELGFFKSLWNNGDFQNLFTALTDNFRNTSLLTAETIAQAANKVGILNQAINTEAGGLTSGGIASIMREVALGNVSADEMSSEFVQAMTVSSQGDTIRQEALSNIASLSDYSDSSIAVMEKIFANQGKAFTQSFYQNQFWDKPLQEVISQLPTGIETKYRELLLDSKNQGLTSRQFQQRIRSEMPDFYKYITTIGSKKGDIQDVFNFWDAMGVFNNGNVDAGGLTSPFLHNGEFVGLNPEMFVSLDENGSLLYQGQSYTQNHDQWTLEQAIMSQLDAMGVGDAMTDYVWNSVDQVYERHVGVIDTEQEFRDLAMAYAKSRPDLFGGKTEDEIMAEFVDPLTLYVAEQGGQQIYWDSNAAKEGAAILDQNKFLSEAEVQAYFDANRMKIIDPQTGKLIYGYDNENAYQQFLEDYGLSDNSTGIKSNTFANKPGGVSLEDFNKALNEGRKDAEGNPIETSYTLEDYLQAQEGVYNSKNGTFNYDAALEALTGLGGMSAENAKSLLQEQVKQGSSFTTTIRDPNNNFRPTTITVGGENGMMSWDEFQEQVDQYGQMSDSELAANQMAQAVADATLSANAVTAIANKQYEAAGQMIQAITSDTSRNSAIYHYASAKGITMEEAMNELGITQNENTQKPGQAKEIEDSLTGYSMGKNENGEYFITDANGKTTTYTSKEEYDAALGITPQAGTIGPDGHGNYIYTDPNGNKTTYTLEQLQEFKESGTHPEIIGANPVVGYGPEEQTSTNLEDLSRDVIDKIGSSEGFEKSGKESGMDYLTESSGYLQEYSNILDQAIANANGNNVTINGQTFTNTEAQQLSKDIHAILDGVNEQVEQNDELYESVQKGDTTLAEGENANQQVDENGNPVDENGNPIDFGEKSTAETATGKDSEGGGGDSGNKPDDQSYVGNGNGNSSSSTNMADLDQRIQDAFANTTAGSTVTVNGTDENGNTTTTTYTNNGDGTVSTETHVTIDDTQPKASGQNNNLIPQFAAGSNGYVAITGELGPELHIKPNGDIDLLGKHGREYAWVEPNDKIYTAAQTASILGSKKIREMISAHAAGINNFIPGYDFGLQNGGVSGGTVGSLGSSGGGGGSSGGGGGGGGGGGETAPDQLTAENHRFDANWLKYRDILERYYTILQQMEDISIALQRFASLADRAWGKERIDNIEKTIAVQEDQVVAQRAYLSEINTYLRTDKEQMTRSIDEFAEQWAKLYPNRPLGFDGAQFDKNGVLTNYRQIIEAMLDAYNMDVNGYAYAHGMYSVGAVMEQMGQGQSGGLFSTIAGAVAQGVQQGMAGGVVSGALYRDPSADSMLPFAVGQNNDDAQTLREVEVVTTKSQENAQQTVLEEELKDIQFYTQTLNLYQQQLTVLEQMEQQLFDTRLQAIQVEVEYKVSLKNNALTLLDYALAKVKDDAYMAAEAVALIGQEQDINIEILKDYEKQLKDMLNLNLNGEAFFGGEDYKLVPTIETSQLEKDLDEIAKMHEKFWDEESQSYKDHYIENTKTGEISFEEEEEDKLKSLYGGDFSNMLMSINGEGNPEDELKQRHTIDEYNSLIARIYEKYYANYSQYLPDPEKFLQFTNSKKRLEFLEKQSQSMTEQELQQIGNGANMSNSMMASMFGQEAQGEAVEGTPDYLYLIDNADSALDRLNMLSEILNGKTIHADIDKFTSEFKNLGEVSEQLQGIFDGLIEDFPDLGKNIADIDKELIHFNEQTQQWTLDIDNYAEAMKVLDEINKTNRQKLTDEKFEQFIKDPVAFWDWMTDLSENFNFTNFTANEIQMLNQLSTTYLSNIASLKNTTLTQIDYLGNSVKAYAKDMDTIFNKFDHFKNLYGDWQNIIDLTGRSATKLSHDLMVELNIKAVDNAINKLSTAKDQFDAISRTQISVQAHYDQAKAELEAFDGDEEQRYWLRNIVDEYKIQLDKVNKETEEAEDAYMKSWEDTLQGLATAFQAAMKDAALGFEESFSPVYRTIDALSSAVERQRTLRDLYLSPYDQAHGLSQMARDIKQSIIDTDNLNGKRELKKLLDDVNKAQQEGIELSSYDLDIMQKKYDLELARQALEDAKNAKSLVRLSRDNNGNWSYVYTADEDDVIEAEQKYEDAILAIEQANENYIDSLQDQLLQVLMNYEAQVTALNPADFVNEEEYTNRLKEIQEVTTTQINFIQQQMENALGNNNYLLDNVSGKAASIMQGLTAEFDNTMLAMLTGSDSAGALAALSIQNVDNLAEDAVSAYTTFWSRLPEAWHTAGHDLNDASKVVSGAITDISEQSIENIDVMAETVDRAANAFDKLNNALVINANKIYDVVKNYENLATSLNKLIELSGEYIKENTLTIDTNIHSWDQLEDIYSRLSTEGSVWIKYLDENNQEQTKFLEAGTEDTIKWLQSQRESLVDLLIHEIADQVIFDSQKEIDKFMDDLTKTIQNQGLLKLDIKGDLFNKIIGIDPTNKDIYEHWMDGSLEEYTAMFGGNEKFKRTLSTENRAIMEFFENLDELAKENDDYAPDQTGTIKLDWVNDQPGVNHILELLKALLELKKEEVHEGGGGSSDSGGDWWQSNWDMAYQATGSVEGANELFHPWDTGGYTGRWQSADTGMYTGEWANGSVRRNGRLAWLHQKELVLNAHDTENFLDAMEIVRQLDNLTNWMANGLGDIVTPTNVDTGRQEIDQTVTITAEFPNVTNRSEIEEAFENIVNLASQYASHK